MQIGLALGQPKNYLCPDENGLKDILSHCPPNCFGHENWAGPHATALSGVVTVAN